MLLKPGCWHTGNAFVFCPGDCPFKYEPSPSSAHACGEVTGCALATKRLACGAPEVDLGECTLHSLCKKKRIRQNPLWLWNPEIHVSAKMFVERCCRSNNMFSPSEWTLPASNRRRHRTWRERRIRQRLLHKNFIQVTTNRCLATFSVRLIGVRIDYICEVWVLKSMSLWFRLNFFISTKWNEINLFNFFCFY